MGGGFGNQESQYYSPDNVTVEDGKLVITARKEKHPNATYEEYTSAKLVSKFAKNTEELKQESSCLWVQVCGLHFG